MKRTLWISIAVLALAAAVTMPLMAQPRQGVAPGRGMGMGMGPGGPGRGGPGGPFGLLRGLNVSDAQREQVRAILEQHRDEAARQQKVAELQQKLQLAILADTADTAAIDQLKSAMAAAHAEQLAARIEVESKIAQVLTTEQRAQARELRSKEPADGSGPGRGRRGGGGFGFRHLMAR